MCVCLFSSHLFRVSSSLDVPAGVTQEEGHTGFLIPLLSAVRALIFLAIRIQPFLSLGDREVELVYQRFNRSPHVGHFIFYFLVRKIPLTGIRTHVPTCQKVTRLLLNDRSDPCPDQNVLVPSIYTVGRLETANNSRSDSFCISEASRDPIRRCCQKSLGRSENTIHHRRVFAFPQISRPRAGLATV